MAQDLPSWQVAAAANLAEARKRNGRIGSKKSRAGCITCKARRVKCDETRPECSRCKNTGRRCDGYEALVAKKQANGPADLLQLSQMLGLTEKDRRTFDYFLSSSASKLAGCLDRNFWCGQVMQLAHAEPFVMDAILAISTLYEHPQYLQKFSVDREDDYERTPDSGIVLPTDRQLPSQQSTGEIEPGFSVLAGQSSTPKRETGEPFGNLTLDEPHRDALRYYNRALQAFRQRVDAGTATSLMALLSCLLFITIEIIRDNIFAALHLFNKGTKLLHSIKPTTDAERELLSTLRLTFARLGVIAATFGHPHAIDMPPEFVMVGAQKVFASMADARSALFALMAGAHQFIVDAAEYKANLFARVNDPPQMSTPFRLLSKSGQAVLPAMPAKFRTRGRDGVVAYRFGQSENDVPADAMSEAYEQYIERTISAPLGPVHLCAEESPDGFRPSLVEKQQELELRLGQWFDAFQWPQSPVADGQPEVASHLLMYYHVSYIWLCTRLSPFQSAFDGFAYHFEQTVHHAEIYVNAMSKEIAHFTFEVGAVPPLYFVATKCRVPSLRRKALRLLKRAPKKECIWGADTTAELAARLMTIEEEGLDLPDPYLCLRGINMPVSDAALPAESKRIHNLEILQNKVDMRYEVRITTYQYEAGGGPVAVEVDVPI